MKQKLEIEINLHQKKSKRVLYIGEPIKGFLKIKALDNLNVQEFGIQLIKVTTGEKDKIVLTKPIYVEDTLSKHEIYRFSFDIINDRHESYQGKKLIICFKIMPYLFTREDGQIKNKTKEYPFNLLEENNIWATRTFLDFDAKISKFTIAPQEKLITHGSCAAIFIYSFLFIYFSIFIVSLLNTGLSFSSLLLIYLIGLGVITIFTQYISKVVLGKIFLEIRKLDEEHFILHIKKEKKWQSIYRFNVHYEIEEINKGSKKSGKSNIHSIFKSNIHKLKPPYEDLAITFKLPKTAPVPFKTKSVQIKWSLKLKLATTFGLNYNFDYDLLVDKHYS